MRTFRNALRYIISLVLMFVFVFLQVGLFVQFTFLNPVFYIHQLETTDYYKELGEDIHFGMRNLSMITSIPVEVLTDTIKSEAIIELSIDNIYKATDYMKYKTEVVESTIDLETIAYPLQRFIEAYAQEHAIKLDEAQREQIDDVAIEAANIVNNHVILFNISAVKHLGEFQRFRKIVFLIYVNWFVPALISILCIASLVALNLKRKRRVFLWSGSSMIAASLMILIPVAMALVYRIPYRLNIGTPYLKNALKAITLGYLQFFLSSGSILLVVGILSLLLYVRGVKGTGVSTHTEHDYLV